MPPSAVAEVQLEEIWTDGSAGAHAMEMHVEPSSEEPRLYIAAVSTKPHRAAADVSGLGLEWRSVATQCSGRSQTGVELWSAYGSVVSGGKVTIDLSGAPTTAVIAVTAWSGIDEDVPVGASARSNSNGGRGACSGGSDSSDYAVELAGADAGSTLFAAVAMRNREHRPGGDFRQLGKIGHGSGGSRSGLAVLEGVVSGGDASRLVGEFDGDVDWAAAAIELRPAVGHVPRPRLTLSQQSLAFRPVAIGGNAEAEIRIENVGDAELPITSLAILGRDGDAFRLVGSAPVALKGGEARALKVEFNPETAGAKEAVLQIEAKQHGQPLRTVRLEGHALAHPAPVLSVGTERLRFGALIRRESLTLPLEIANRGSEPLRLLRMRVAGPDAASFTVDKPAPVVLEAGERAKLLVRFSPTSERKALARLEIESNDPDRRVASIQLSGRRGGMWISAAELADRPMHGAPWERLLEAAEGPLGTPRIADLHSEHEIRTLAAALVWARTGEPRYREKAAKAIAAAIGTDEGGTAHAVGRNGASYIIAADLIGLADHDPELDRAFRAWLEGARDARRPDGTLIEDDESRANNHGRYAGATRAAIAIYLDDREDLERAARVFRGVLGDRDAYDGFLWKNDLSWQPDPDRPVAIAPLGATKDGRLIDGALTEEMRRGCSYAVPPCYTQYPWEALQGLLVEAILLDRQGYDAFEWSDRAIFRAVAFLHRLQAEFPREPWWATGDDTFVPWLVNAAYDTGFPTAPALKLGDIVHWTDWTHSGSAGK